MGGPLRGGRQCNSGRGCVDVYPPLGGSPSAGESVAGFARAVVGTGFGNSSRWGVGGPVREGLECIAGLWGRMRFGHVGVRSVVVRLGWGEGGKKIVSSGLSRQIA